MCVDAHKACKVFVNDVKMVTYNSFRSKIHNFSMAWEKMAEKHDILKTKIERKNGLTV